MKKQISFHIGDIGSVQFFFAKLKHRMNSHKDVRISKRPRFFVYQTAYATDFTHYVNYEYKDFA